MDHYRKIIILILIAITFFVPAVCAAAEQSVNSLPLIADMVPAGISTPVPLLAPAPQLTAGSEPVGNYSKLEIMPSNLNFVVEPNERKEITVTVRNRDTKSVHVQPMIRQQPYGGPYVAENSWTSLTPASADIAVGESAKFTVAVLVPAETLRGMYNSQVTFTDEAYPTPYPQPFPGYIHTLGLTINVASSPLIQISTPYINDQLEAGNEYTYTVDVKNKGSTPLALNAKIGDDSYPMYGPFGPQEPPLNAKAFTISASSVIPPGQNGTVTLKVNVPQNACGYFNGNVDLGIDDPEIRLEESRIQINFQIWKQPEGGFAKTFWVAAEEPIAIELTSAMPQMGPMTGTGTTRNMP
ncbi:MAG: hypothetical protein Q7T80_13235, partial [Methanoregula sp.]|nr:hypothetical protein [Methanoregula sp.]